jgi:outer membrane murein-binding lipoprotein Lpp
MAKESPMTAAQAKKLHSRIDSLEKEVKDLKRERDAALKQAAKATATKEEPKKESAKEESTKEEKPKKTFLSRLLGD